MTPTHDELPGYDRTGYWFAGCRPDELPWAIRRLVLARDDFGCVCCGRSVLGQPYSIHVRRPLGTGRDRSPENLITVLGACGERLLLGGDPADEMKGYNVRPWQDPALVPVTYATPAGHACLWLLPDGGRAPRPQAQPPARPLQLLRQAGEREGVDVVVQTAGDQLEPGVDAGQPVVRRHFSVPLRLVKEVVEPQSVHR